MNGVDTELVELVGCVLDNVDLVSGKAVASVFAPIRDPLRLVEIEAQRFDPLLSNSGVVRCSIAPSYPPALWKAAIEPNPPRVTDDEEAAPGAPASRGEFAGADEALVPKPPRITVVLTDSTL